MATANAAAGLWSGEILPPELGKYQVLRELGRGGMGVVYLAEDTSLCRQVALKAIFPQFSADAVFLARFQAEARALASFSHQGIVRINSLENLGGRMLIDMEYIQGISMADQLAAGPMPAARAVEIAALVLQALAACHARGITHRDIKPNNILLEQSGRVVLTDFGLSQAFAAVLEETVTRSSSSGFFQGTPRYAPPEAWDGVPAAPAWDLFSVGAILYEAIAGRPVYTGTTPMAIMKQVLVFDTVEFGGVQVSPQLRDLIAQLLSRAPANRPQSAVETLEHLAATPEAADLRVDTSVQLSWAPKPRRRIRIPVKNITTIGAMALIIVAIAALLQFMPSFIPPTSTGPATNAVAPLQEEVLKDRLVEHASLLDLRRFATPARTVEVELLEGENASRALGLLDDATSPTQHLTLFAKSALWSVQLTQESEDAVKLQGDWGDYVPTNGMLLRLGTLSGKGHAVATEGSLTANVRLENKRNNSESVITLSFRPAQLSDTRFLYALEAEPLVQRLLANELLPRNLPWAVKVEALLPAFAGSRVAAPMIPEPTDNFKLDGLLNDSIWTNRYYDDEQGRVGELPGSPTSGKSTLSVRCTPSTLYLGVAFPVGAAGLTLAITLPEVGPDAPEMRYELHVSGSGTDTRALHDNKEIRWISDWQSALQGESAEFRVPLEGLRIARPSDLASLRFVLFVGDAKGTPIAAWGGTTTADAAHGALLHFTQAKGSSQ